MNSINTSTEEQWRRVPDICLSCMIDHRCVLYLDMLFVVTQWRFDYQWALVIFRVKWRVVVRCWYLCLWLWFGLVEFIVMWLVVKTHYQQRLVLESWYTNLEPDPALNRCQQLTAPYKRLIQAKPTDLNKQWADRNSKTTLKRPITATLNFWRSITSRQNWPIKTTTKGTNTVIWRRLLTWWLPLRWSKCQSPPPTVFLKTIFTRMITQDKQLILLGSNHLLTISLNILLFPRWSH